jgi:hypothetical protein
MVVGLALYTKQSAGYDQWTLLKGAGVPHFHLSSIPLSHV